MSEYEEVEMKGVLIVAVQKIAEKIPCIHFGRSRAERVNCRRRNNNSNSFGGSHRRHISLYRKLRKTPPLTKLASTQNFSQTLRLLILQPSKSSKNGPRQEEQVRQELRVYQLQAPACCQVWQVHPRLQAGPQAAPIWQGYVKFILGGGISRWCKENGRLSG